MLQFSCIGSLRLKLLFLLLALLIWGVIWIQQLPSPWLEPQNYATIVTARDGEYLALFTNKDGRWRFPQKWEDVDKRWLEYLLAVEDKKFFQHSGIDWLAILRAVIENFRAGRIVSGASTISMQTVRLLQPRARTFRHKIIEMIQAWRMEHDLSKQQILSLYLSLTPYGGNLQGLEAASYFYWHKKSRELNLSQKALLIALPQAPEQWRPDRYPEKAKAARNRILGKLLQSGYIDQHQYQLASVQPVPTRYARPRVAPHLAQWLFYKNRQRVEPAVWVRSTINWNLQQRVQRMVADYVQYLEKGQDIAVWVVDNQTYQTIAAIGAIDFSKRQNDLSRAVRSPGSSLKPLLYGLGFQMNKLHPQTKVLDAPMILDDGYAPKNFDNRYRGVVSIEQALLDSLNIPAVKAIEHIGVQFFYQYLEDFSITLKLPAHELPGVGVILGGVGITLQELVALYTAIANSGRFQKLQTTFRVDTADEHSEEHRKIRQLLSARASCQLDGILKKMPQGMDFNEIVRYKTGTSYAYQDLWSIGYQRNFTVGVWIGYPQPQSARKITAAELAVPLMFKIFSLLPQPVESSEPCEQSDLEERLLLADHKIRQSLPRHLRWLGKKQSESDLAITYPIDRSKLILSGRSGISSARLPLRLRGGSRPYYWFINGKRYVSHKQAMEVSVKAGKHQINLIDANGDQVSIQVTIEIE